MRRKLTALFAILLLVVGGYYLQQKLNKPENELRYLSEEVKKGILVNSINGTGQINTSNQVDIKSKVSGDVVAVKVASGDQVKKDDVLIQIDSREAARSVAEASASLEVAQLDLEELLSPADPDTLLQAKYALADAEDDLVKLKLSHKKELEQNVDDKETAENNLEKAYEDAYNEVADAFLDLPDIMTGIYSIIFSNGIVDSGANTNGSSNKSAFINSINSNDWEERTEMENYLLSSENKYRAIKTDYDHNASDFREVSRISSREDIEEILNQTLETVRDMADLLKKETNAVDYWINYRTTNDLEVFSIVSGYQSSLGSYTSTINSQISGLLSSINSIDNYKKTIISLDNDLEEMLVNQPLEIAKSERTIDEKKSSLADLEAGADEITIKNKQISVQQKVNSLIKTQQTYSDYFVKAPFDGVIVGMEIAVGDNLSSGGTITTLITEQMIAEITLNEIDVANVKVGQKVNLEFDAVEEISITGQIVDVDVIGTVTQGIVSYNVKIAFDVEDERVKPGMSVSASIILETKPNVLLVPFSAIKNDRSGDYVETLVEGKPERRNVTKGSSNDTMVEIIDGLTEGEVVITQTIQSSNASVAQPSSGSSFGGGGAQGDTFRAMRSLQ